MITGPHEGLTPVEQEAIGSLANIIVSTRDERRERILGAIESFEAADKITREVAIVAIKSYIADSEPEQMLIRPDFERTGNQVCYHAPGLYIADGKVKDDLMATGDFVTAHEFRSAAESLSFTRDHAQDAADFLYRWVASRYPDSPASRTVNEMGIGNERMSHGSRGNFRSWNVLFHTTVAQEYIDQITKRTSLERRIVDPIICLAATDDWDRALSLTSPGQQKRINRG